MTKQYRHRKLGWVAKGIYTNAYSINISDGNSTWHSLPKKLIEDSNDWELIEEKDWIDEVIETYNRNYTHLNDHKIRQAIKKHMPKVSEEEIYEYTKKDWEYKDVTSTIIELLKSKGLLAE